MPNLLSMYLLKRMLNVSGPHVTIMVVLFQLGSIAIMSILKLIKTALHKALENIVARNAISITAAKKTVLLSVMYHLQPPHALWL